MRISALVPLCLFGLLSDAAPLRQARDVDLIGTRCPDFCAGTKSGTNPEQYVCGDQRLGPVSLPAGLPLEGIAGTDSIYRRFGGLCPGAFLAKWTNATSGEFVFPPLNGYSQTAEGQTAFFNLTLTEGLYLDRFGSEFGFFMSPAGTPYAQRSLPPTNLNAPPGAMFPNNYHVYNVSKQFVVQGGLIAGWFGQQGLGVQLLMPSSVMSLVDQGFLSRVDMAAYAQIQ